MPAPKRMVSLDTGKDFLTSWERCCDSASCQSRTVRPSSQLNTSARRPASRESSGSSEWGWLRPTSYCRLEGMEQFRRSLRLIGLKPEDIGLTSPKPAQTSPRHYPDVRSAKPKLNTRLQRRTVSADDLRTLLEECPVKDSVKRGMVAKAVYEEWYFKKQEEIRKRKEMEKGFEAGKISDMEAHKREHLERNKARFDEWVKHKAAKKKEELSRPPDKKGSLNKRTMSNPEQAQAAFITWKQSKEKLLKMEKTNTKGNDSEQEREVKRADAEKAFKHWKEKKEEELQRVLLEKKKIDLKIKEDEERIKQQKIKESEISFKVWKLKKDRELQENLSKINADEKKKDEAKKAVDERRYEANQAFLEWLDSVEQRERNQQSQTRKETPRSSRRLSPVRFSESRNSMSSSRASSPGPWKSQINVTKVRKKPLRSKGN